MTIKINRNLFKSFIRDHDVTLTQLSKDSGMSISALSKFINGRTKDIKVSSLMSILEIMNLNKRTISDAFIIHSDFPAGKINRI